MRTLIRGAVFVGGLALLAGSCGDDSGGGSNGATAPGGNDTTVEPTDDTDAGEPTDRSGELVGNWTITTFQLAGGLGEAPIVGPDPATIVFAGDGTFTYSTGCNTGDGEWEPFGVYQPPSDNGFPEGQAVSFDGLSQTEEECDEELADQDLAIGGAIRATDIFTLDGSTLTLLRDGNLMLAATRG